MGTSLPIRSYTHAGDRFVTSVMSVCHVRSGMQQFAEARASSFSIHVAVLYSLTAVLYLFIFSQLLTNCYASLKLSLTAR